MKPINVVLFDLDGTLTDPKEGITKSIQFALGKLGISIPDSDTLRWCIGPPLNTSFKHLLESSDESLIKQAIAHYRARFTEVGMFENKVYPDVLQTLEKIKAMGIVSYVATSKPHVFAKKILEHFGLADFFQVIYGSELDGTYSDKGELIAYLLKSENIDPETALMVGDRKHDILGGYQNNIRTAAVTYGYGSVDEIAESKPDFIFNHPLELVDLLVKSLN